MQRFQLHNKLIIAQALRKLPLHLFVYGVEWLIGAKDCGLTSVDKLCISLTISMVCFIIDGEAALSGNKGRIQISALGLMDSSDLICELNPAHVITSPFISSPFCITSATCDTHASSFDFSTVD